MSIPKPPLEKTWAVCPHCGAKAVIFDNTAHCSGVYLKCTRKCQAVFELRIQDGKQILNK